jgi:hypothetical protein
MSQPSPVNAPTVAQTVYDAAAKLRDFLRQEAASQSDLSKKTELLNDANQIDQDMNDKNMSKLARDLTGKGAENKFHIGADIERDDPAAAQYYDNLADALAPAGQDVAHLKTNATG